MNLKKKKINNTNNRNIAIRDFKLDFVPEIEDFKHIFVKEIEDTLEQLTNVQSKINSFVKFSDLELLDEKNELIEITTEFKLNNGVVVPITFYIFEEFPCELEYSMLGGMGEWKKNIDKDVTDTIVELISNSIGSICTPINNKYKNLRITSKVLDKKQIISNRYYISNGIEIDYNSNTHYMFFKIGESILLVNDGKYKELLREQKSLIKLIEYIHINKSLPISLENTETFKIKDEKIVLEVFNNSLSKITKINEELMKINI